MTDDRAYLMHIRDAAERILKYTKDGKLAFEGDHKTQDAVIRNIEIIGETTKCLSQALRANYPEIPWKRIAGMRDVLIHGYFFVRLDRVWQVVANDLPILWKR